MTPKILFAVWILILAPFVLSTCAVPNIGAEDDGGIPFLVAASDAPQAVKNVAMYVVDGVDDQAEIQQAVDMAAPGRVQLSSGTFNITSAIYLKQGSVLEGEGWGDATDPATSNGTTTLVVSNGVTALAAVNKNYVRVAHLKIYGGHTGVAISTTSGAGIHRAFTLENLAVNGQTGSGSVGISIKGAGPSDLLTGWKVTNVVVRRVNGVGILVQHATDWFALDWYALGTNKDGILIRDSASFNATNIRADFAGPGGGGDYSGIHLLNVNHATLTNVSASDNNAAGLLINTAGSDIQIVGGWIRDNGADANLPDYRRAGIIVAAVVRYVTIQGVHSYNAAERPVQTQQYGFLDAGPLHSLIGNTFHGNGVASIRNVDPGAVLVGNRGIN